MLCRWMVDGGWALVVCWCGVAQWQGSTLNLRDASSGVRFVPASPVGRAGQAIRRSAGVQWRQSGMASAGSSNRH